MRRATATSCQLQMPAVIKKLWQCLVDVCLEEVLISSGSADIEHCSSRFVEGDLVQP